MGDRLYVGNLSFKTRGDAIRDAFARCGDVTDMHLGFGGGAKRSRW
jgi:RNA recognition motif-containing protein